MGNTIAVIGAGPKAAALVALAAAMKMVENAPVPPKIIVFDRHGVGSAWSGQRGFSNGYLTLCTPGEKDVGFPYSGVMSALGSETAIASQMFSRFSWPAFLVSQAKYVDWVDRGRDHPTHESWAHYLRWVFKQAEQPNPIRADLAPKSIKRLNDRWQISAVVQGKPKTFDADGIVLTGTGPVRPIIQIPGVPGKRVLDAETFWKQRNTLQVRRGKGIAVAGTGGAAATILAWLVQHYAETNTPIFSIGGSGTLFPRGDGYSERRWFSNAEIESWQRLTVEHRTEIIDRTESGVVSERYKSILDQAPRLFSIPGRASSVRWITATNVHEQSYLEISVEYNGVKQLTDDADILINATGFDQWKLLELIDNPAARALLKTGKNAKARRLAEQLNIGPDLCFQRLPGIHIPALASLQQGPGMGNLGCLGTMAEAIIKPYQTQNRLAI